MGQQGRDPGRIPYTSHAMTDCLGTDEAAKGRAAYPLCLSALSFLLLELLYGRIAPSQHTMANLTRAIGRESQ
jgi:hypothetical protein